MYVDIPESRLSLTVIETKQADGFAPTPTAVIIPANKIMENRLTSEMTDFELIQLSETLYMNSDFNLAQRKYFIDFNDSSLEEPWHILIVDDYAFHHELIFIEAVKINHIYPVALPSHKTRLLYPLDVGSFRKRKAKNLLVAFCTLLARRSLHEYDVNNNRDGAIRVNEVHYFVFLTSKDSSFVSEQSLHPNGSIKDES